MEFKTQCNNKKYYFSNYLLLILIVVSACTCFSSHFVFTKEARATETLEGDSSSVTLVDSHTKHIFLQPQLQTDVWGNSPLILSFLPDETLCKSKYGENWREECSAWLGKTGTVPQGIDNYGWPDGEWLWINSSTLRFTPSGYWKGETTYEIDLQKLPLPPQVVLLNSKPSFTHGALSAQMGEAQLWVDPSKKAEHALSFSMNFTESVDEATRKYLEENAWPQEQGNFGLELSNGEWVWLQDNTAAVVNARILRLPKERSVVSLTLPEVRTLWREDGWKFSDIDASKSLVIAGTDNIFTLTGATLEQYQNKALQMEQHLVFRFSQRVEPEELLKVLTVLELPLHRSEENIVPSNWHDGAVGKETRDKARVLKPELVRLAGESGDVLRFRIDTTPEHYILWNIEAGFGPTSAQGVKTPLAKNLEGIEFIPSGEIRLDFLQAGSVLMEDSDIAIMSENVDSIRWGAYRVMDTSLALPFLTSLDTLLNESERNAIAEVTRGEIFIDKTQNSAEAKKGTYTSTPVFSVLKAQEIFSKYPHNLPIEKQDTQVKEAQTKASENEKSIQDNTSRSHVGNVHSGLVYLHVQGIKDNQVVREMGRILMYSNMGLVLKKLSDESMEAYVCALNSAEALENIKIDVIGYNGLVVAEARTDSTGKAIIPDLSSFREEKRPVAIVARRLTESKGKPHVAMHAQENGENSESAQNRQNSHDASKMQDNSEQVLDMLWISLQDYGRYVNVSRFHDLGGKQSGVNSLNAFVFAERGLFSPGEVLNFGTLLRANDWKLLPQDMPLLATIQDAGGKKVFEQKFAAGDNIHSFSWDIPKSVMTGQYRLSIGTPSSTPATDRYSDNMGLILGSTTVRVEGFLPDTLRLKTELVRLSTPETNRPTVLSTKGWIVTSANVDNIALQVQLDTLFGQVAQDRRVTSVMRLSPAYLSFPDYEEYIFQDVSPYFGTGIEPVTKPLKSCITDENGQAFIPLDFAQWRFGTMQCTIKTEGYEAGGGRAVSQEKRFLLSPMSYMLGYKTGQGADNKEFILKDSLAQLEFQAINAQLEGVNIGELVFSISRRHTVQSLISDSLGRYTYAQTPVETEISTQKELLSEKGTLTWNIPTHEVGDYVLTIRASQASLPKGSAMTSSSDLEVGENTAKTSDIPEETQVFTLAQISFSIVGNDDLRPALHNTWQLPEAHLHIKTDRNSYNAGEKAQIMLTAPYDGVALISLERDTVAAHKWVQIPLGVSMHSIDIPKEFSGRAYIQVLMGRAPQSDNIFIQPQSVAMTSVSVNVEEKKIPLQIHVDDKVKPGETIIARIGNTQGAPVQAIVFAVDEGVLQLSHYKTPDPLDYLLLDRALDVRTAQLFDRFIAQDQKVLSRLSAFGGDGLMLASERNMLGSFQNPFKRKSEKPVAWWSGVVEIPTEGLEVEIPVPNYFNGSLRLMVVGQNEEAVGHAEANVVVQDELIMTTQVPTMLALGDSFIGGVNISNTTDKTIHLKTSIECSSESSSQRLDQNTGQNTEQHIGQLVEISDFTDVVTLAPYEETYLTFKAQTLQDPGVVNIQFNTEDGDGVKRSREASISIRPALLPRYSQQSFIINNSTQIQANRTLLPFEAQKNLTLSPIPLPLLQSSLNYLYNYPYVCVEQSLSKAFPLVALSGVLGTENADIVQVLAMLEKNVPSLKSEARAKILKSAHNALLDAFSPYNGITLLEHRRDGNVFLTAYAADYILALKDAGLAVPPGILPQLFTTLERSINESPASLDELRALAYASWVLARAGYVVSRQLELCENYIRRFGLDKSDIYSTLMAGSYRALYMEEEAQKHLNNVLGTKPQTWDKTQTGMFDVLAQYGLHARVLAKHFPMEFQESIPLMQEVFLEGLNKPHATLGASMVALGLVEILRIDQNQNIEQNSMQHIEIICEKFQENTNTKEVNTEIFHNLYAISAPLCERFNIQLNNTANVINTKYFAQLEYDGYDTTIPTKPLEQGMRVSQNYSLESGMPFTSSVVQGEVIRVDIDVNLFDNNEIPVAIVSLLPGGFELVLNHEEDSNSSQNMTLMRDEDRVIAFLDARREKMRITYHMRAITQGDFALPLVHAEGLFDSTLQSHTVGARVHVVAP